MFLSQPTELPPQNEREALFGKRPALAGIYVNPQYHVKFKLLIHCNYCPMLFAKITSPPITFIAKFYQLNRLNTSCKHGINNSGETVTARDTDPDSRL